MLGVLPRAHLIPFLITVYVLIVISGPSVVFTVKGLVIFTAVLPTFIDRAEGHATLQLATLGVICGLIAALSDGVWAVASGSARAWLGRSPRRLEWLSAGGGVTMIALGAALAITGRRT